MSGPIRNRVRSHDDPHIDAGCPDCPHIDAGCPDGPHIGLRSAVQHCELVDPHQARLAGLYDGPFAQLVVQLVKAHAPRGRARHADGQIAPDELMQRAACEPLAPGALDA